MLKPNWPFIAIVSAAIVTVGIVVVIFVSTSGTATHSTIPTTVALSKTPTASTEKDVALSIAADGCVFLTVDGTKSFAIWPKGYTKDSSGDVLAPDGSTYADGDTIHAATVVTNRAALIKLDGGGDDGYLGSLMTQCQGSDTHAVIVTTITG